MVPDKHLARVAGANQTLQGLLNIIAPPLGALLIELYATQNVLLVDIATAALAIPPLLFIAIPQPAKKPQGTEGNTSSSFTREFKEGFSYVWKWKGMLGIIILAMLLNFLLIPAASFMPLMVTKIFNKGAAELGWIQSLFGVGIIAGGILLSTWGGFKRRIITSFSGILGIGTGILLMGFIPENMFYLLFVAYFFVGFTQVFANGPLMAIMQSTVTPDMQGRVFSLLGTGAAAMMPLSLLVAGPISDAVGLRFWYIFGGSVCIIMILIAFFVPAIINIEDNHSETPAPATE